MSGVLEKRRVAGVQPNAWTAQEQAALDACIRALIVAVPTRAPTAIGRRVRETMERLADEGAFE